MISWWSNKKILNHSLLPLSLVKQLQIETNIIDKVYTIEEAIESSIILSRNKMEDKLLDNEYIIKEKQLKVDIKDSKIEVDIFYSVYEDITGYQLIIEEVKEDV